MEISSSQSGKRHILKPYYTFNILSYLLKPARENSAPISDYRLKAAAVIIWNNSVRSTSKFNYTNNRLIIICVQTLKKSIRA